LAVAEGTYDVVIEIEGEDDVGSVHTVELNLELSIKKVSRDVIIAEASLFPDRIVCSGSSTITATIRNLGSRLEEEGGIEIVNSDLGINFDRRNIELDVDPFDSENQFTKKINIDISRDTKAGTYPIIVNAYIKGDILWESKTANLVVEACSGVVVEEEVEEEAEETELVEVSDEEQEEEIVEGVAVPILKPTTTTEIPLTRRPGFWIAVFVFNIIIIGGAVYFVASLAGKK